MDSSLLTLSLYIFCLLSIVQGDFVRRVTCGVFSLMVILHWNATLSVPLDSDHYWAVYLSAALTDLLIMHIIAGMRKTSNLGIQLLLICGASALFNFIGVIMWFMRMDPDIYNWAFVALNFYAVYCMINKEPQHGRLGAGSRNGFVIWRHLISGYKQDTGL